MTSRTGSEPADGPGFTLIEVLVTVAILAGGIALVLQAFGTSMSALAASNDTLRASLILREKMNDIERAVREDGTLPDGPREGLLDVGTAGTFRWAMHSVPVTVLHREIQQVTITVWRDGQQRRSSLTTRFRTVRGED